MNRSLVLLFAVLSVACTSIAKSQPPTQVTLGTRSPHYDFRLGREVVSTDQIAYDLRLTDIDSGNVLLSSRATGKPGEAVDVSSVSGDLRAHVRLAYTPSFFSATVNVTRGASVVDSFRTWWQLEPRAATSEMDAAPAGIRAPNAYRVGGDVKAPIVIRRVEPVYPAEARREHITGVVIIEALVGKDGKVKDAVVLRGLPEGMSEAAAAAIREWEFKPGTLNGEPVDVIFNLTVNFKLDTPTPMPPPRP